MQGDCSEAPPAQILEQVRGVPLVPLTPGQCLLVTDKSLFYLGAGRLWMHNLYLRHTATNVSYPVVTMVGPSVLNVEAQLWMTSCTLQGYGQYDSGFGASGLTLRSKAYMEGSPFLQSRCHSTSHGMRCCDASCCCLLCIALAMAPQQIWHEA